MNYHVLFYNAVNEERRQMCEHGKVIPFIDLRAQREAEITRFCRGFCWMCVGLLSLIVTAACIFYQVRHHG